MSTGTTKEHPRRLTSRVGRRDAGRIAVGGFFLSMGGVHLGLVAADPQVYDSFAAQSYLPFVRNGWQHIFMAHPALWGLLLMAGEIVLGVLLLLGGRPAAYGWVGVIVFHVLLMLFGWWIWVWSVPALVILGTLAWHERAGWPIEDDDGPQWQH